MQVWSEMTETAKKAGNGGLGLALDFGPLLVFFLAYKFLGMFAGTAAFMVALTIAVVVSKLKLGRVSPMLWLTAVLGVGFGALTILLHDPKFIQIKPTIIYALLAGLLFIGLIAGRPMLKYVLEAAYEGLSDTGWLKLSRNWAWFFAGMAVLNEVVRAQFSFDDWLTIKVWGVTILSVLFAAANIPMLMRNGMAETLGKDAPPVPPQG